MFNKLFGTPSKDDPKTPQRTISTPNLASPNAMTPQRKQTNATPNGIKQTPSQSQLSTPAPQQSTQTPSKPVISANIADLDRSKLLELEVNKKGKYKKKKG